MAYTTPAAVKRMLPYEYQNLCDLKLIEDGYIAAIEDWDTVAEEAFLTVFINQAADAMDAEAGGPFEANGLLEEINRIFALYAIEMYIKSGQEDRNIGITIFQSWKEMRRKLEQIRDGVISVTPTGSSSGNLAVLVEPDDDGDALTVEGLGETLYFDGL